MSLTGSRIVLSGLPAQQTNTLKKKIRDAGAFVEYLINDKTAFVVVSESEYTHGSSKVELAKKKKVPLVKPEYLEAYFNASSSGEVSLNSYLYDPMIVEEEEGASSNKRALNDDGETESRKKMRTDHIDVKTETTKSNSSNNSTTDAAKGKANEPAKAKRKRQAPQSGKWRTARVFISSTFKDMHGERDYLTRYVFPELQERCQKLRVHVHPVDLRWGVTSEDTGNALELCLTELDNCRPFFIGLLGSRYGWTPEKYVVPDEPRFSWLRVTPPGRSITHLEMEYGALREPSQAKAAFYFRNPGFLENVPADYKADFMAETPSSSISLQELKEKIKDKMPAECIFEDYPCGWRGAIDGKPMVGHLEEFGKHVLETFWKYFQQEFPITKLETDPLAIERGYHERFVESHSRLFVGRQALLTQIRDFTNSTAPHPLVITGQPGSGKTSLVSYFAHEFSKEMKNSSTNFVLIHFIGAAPGSTSIRLSLSRLLSEIAAHYEFADKIPEDFKELQTLFHDFISRVGKMDDTKMILIIDALNQLDSTNHAHSLEWLPEEFPANVRMIVSTLPGDVHEVLQRRQKTEINVGPLSSQEQTEIIRQTLAQYSKKLDAKQTSLLLGKPDANKPLYLIVACEELRVFGVFEQVSQRIEKMAGTIPKLFEEVLQRIEKDHDRNLVVKTLCFLTCSRGGLLETELLKLLGTRSTNDPLPQNTWAGLYRSLVSYLRPPGESGEGVLDFFHQQLPKAVKRLYLADAEFEKKIQGELADFFWESADPDKNGSWDSGNKRGYAYTVYHQIRAQQWENLKHSLCNLAFIEGKCEMGMTYDLVADYLLLADYKKSIPEAVGAEFSEYHRFVMGRAHVLAHNPSLTFSMAYSLPNDSLPFKQAHFRYYQAHSESRPFLKWLNKSQTANPCLMTLSGHDMVVRCCAISPEPKSSVVGFKRKIVAGSDDNTLKLYDATTGEEIITLKGHTNSVLTCTFNHTGDRVVSGGYDKTLRVWNVDTGLVVEELKGHKGIITSVACHPKNNLIASGSKDKTVKIWLDNSLVKALEGHTKEVLNVSFSPDGNFLASAAGDNSVKIWRTSNWELERTLTHHARPVNSVQWSHDSTRLVTASDDRTVVVLKVTGETEATLKGHKDGATWATFNKNGTRVLSASHDNIITLWDARTGNSLSMLIGHTGSVFSVHYTSSDSHAVSCSFDRSVKVWEVRENIENIGHEARILAVSFSPDGKFVATGSRDKTLKIWDTLKGTELHHLRGHSSNVFGLCWSPDGKQICSASRDKSIKVWETSTGMCVQTLQEHTNSVRCVAWSPDGRHVLSVADDKTAVVWDAYNSFSKIGTLFGHRAEVIYCAYSSDCRRAATCSDDFTIKLWDTKKGSLNYGSNYVKVATLIHHTKGVKAIDFAPDCKSLVSGSEDNSIIQWNARNAKVMNILEGHTEDIRGVRWTSDGRYIVSGSTDSTLKLWNAKTKQVECAFASFGRLCALDATNIAFQRVFACGDGSGALYIITPEGLKESDDKDSITDILPTFKPSPAPLPQQSTISTNESSTKNSSSSPAATETIDEDFILDVSGELDFDV